MIKDEFSDLIGKTLTSVRICKDLPNEEDSIVFFTDSGQNFKMYHDQDCCEMVNIEDVCGEIDWLIGSPILIAEERTNSGDEDGGDSFTWTFYEIATLNGAVTIRWYGSSNGYYSERVTFKEGK